MHRDTDALLAAAKEHADAIHRLVQECADGDLSPVHCLCYIDREAVAILNEDDDCSPPPLAA